MVEEGSNIFIKLLNLGLNWQSYALVQCDEISDVLIDHDLAAVLIVIKIVFSFAAVITD